MNPQFAWIMTLFAAFIAWRINSRVERELFRVFQTIHTGATEFWLHDDEIVIKRGRHALAVVAH